MPPRSKPCRHGVLQLDPSPFAELAGYAQPDLPQRAADVTTIGQVDKVFSPNESYQTFPAPLVLPHDDLNYDPDCEPQNVKEWLHAKTRNKMKPKLGRDTLYVGHVPKITKEVSFMRDWTTPAIDSLVEDRPSSPDVQLFVKYLQAFYHGMNVQTLKTDLQWTTWDKASQPSRKTALPKYVALQYGDVRTRTRVRKAPDGAFPAQLNLNDIIDAAIAMLPSDAYALMLLVDHDIHEDEDDDFCCGRAYGGSRVAVVQTARYNPALDTREKIDHAHMWPLSHCKTFVDDLCAVEDVLPKKPTKSQILASEDGPIRMAVDAAMGSATSSSEVRDISALWFSRLARTVSHEIGHCFGIAHCVYYACNMQGTAGMKEDVRQPPYLCPICEAKVRHAIAGELLGGGLDVKQRWTKERCEAIRLFCKVLQQSHNDTSMWQGLNAWVEARLKAL